MVAKNIKKRVKHKPSVEACGDSIPKLMELYNKSVDRALDIILDSIL